MIQKSPSKREQAQQMVRATLSTEGWQIVEEFFKKTLTDEYAKFMKIKQNVLKNHQIYVTLLLDVIDSIYSMAGLKWTWSGFKEAQEVIDEKKTKERELLEEYLESIRG